MAGPELDLGGILRTLLEHQVDFIAIGGIAAQVHGNPRATFDVDVVPNPAEANMGGLVEALRELEATARDEKGTPLPLDFSHPASLAVGNYFLVTRLGPLDLFNGPRPDLKRYRRLDDRVIEVPYGSHTLKVVGLDDLISMKREAGRDKDLEDIAAITASEQQPDVEDV